MSLNLNRDGSHAGAGRKPRISRGDDEKRQGHGAGKKRKKRNTLPVLENYLIPLRSCSCLCRISEVRASSCPSVFHISLSSSLLRKKRLNEKKSENINQLHILELLSLLTAAIDRLRIPEFGENPQKHPVKFSWPQGLYNQEFVYCSL